MLKAIFPKNVREISLFGLTQWDKGQSLSISFEDMPEKFQVHFSLRGSNNAYTVDVTTYENCAVAQIPDELLTSGEDIYAWIYLTGKNSGETVGKATLYVKPRAEPKGYMESLVPSQQRLVENIITELRSNLEYIKANGVDAEYIPSYVKQEAERVAKNVLAVQKDNTFTFALLSDIHLDSSDYYSKKSFEHAGQALKLIRSMCKIDFAATLGDYIVDGSNKSLDDGKSELLSINRQLSDSLGNVPQMRLIGPEDLLIGSYYRNGGYLDLNALFPIVGKWCSDGVFNAEDSTSGYFYKDFDKEKYRVICLNTSDIKPSDAISTNMNTAQMSLKQLRWFCQALKLSDKQDCTDWKILILSHYPINYYSNFSALEEIIKAYVARTELAIIYEGTDEIACDFSRCSGGEILAMFCGELHNFKVNILDSGNIPMICIPNVSYIKNNFYSGEEYTSSDNLLYGEEITYDKTQGSAKDTAFCIVTIDKGDGTIYAHCYGAGYDRTIKADGSSSSQTSDEGGDDSGDTDEPSQGGDGEDDDNQGGSQGDGQGSGNSEPYTNLVSTSVDDNGAIFSEDGYINGFYLNDEGDAISSDDYTYTGYMPCKTGDTIYIKGGEWSSEVGNKIILCDSDFSIVGTLPLNGVNDLEMGVSYTSGVVCIDTQAFSFDKSVAYFRLSAKCDGKDLIATVNEKIPSASDSPQENVSYTNILSISTEENGELFNGGLGYADSYALTSGGEIIQLDSYTVTGYIDADNGAVLRFKNYDKGNDEYNRLAVFDEDCNFIFAVSFNSEDNLSDLGVSFSNGILIFDSGAVTNYELPELFHVRLSTKAKGKDLIITYDEEIE